MTKVELRNLGVFAYVNGVTLWHYKANSAKRPEDIIGPEFITVFRDMLTPGDIIYFTTETWSAQRTVVFNENKVLTLRSLS